MKISALAETAAGETRTAITPAVVRKYCALGASVCVQTGAGAQSRISDDALREAGASIAETADAALRDAAIVLAVRRPAAKSLKAIKGDTALIAMLDPHDATADLPGLATSGASAFAIELLPRITRAQSMDVLSSQSNLAGYGAVIEAAAAFDRAFPMMMTAAGTVPAARVFIMGAGVAGLQAIATARRLGAIVSATDVRPAAREQVESLGAKFIAVEDDEFRQAETAGGYARPMSEAYQKKQAELVAAHIAKQDIIITTALIPGRPAPRLVSAQMIAAMPPGGVIVDMAIERGGNVEGAKAGQTATLGDIRIIGHENLPARLAASASALYARNLQAFVETMIDREKKMLAIDWDDELVTATLLTRGGKIVHPAFSGSNASTNASTNDGETS